jgi:hypothetical protein
VPQLNYSYYAHLQHSKKKSALSGGMSSSFVPVLLKAEGDCLHPSRGGSRGVVFGIAISRRGGSRGVVLVIAGANVGDL